jgi:hypothetical protein
VGFFNLQLKVLFRTYIFHVDVDFVKFLNSFNTVCFEHSETKQRSVLLKQLLNSTVYTIVSKSTPNPLIVHNQYVFNYFQTYAQLTRIAYYKSESYQLFTKLISLNTKRGLKQKSFNTLCSALRYIHTCFNDFDNNINSEHPTYSVFYNFSRTFFENFYRPDFFIRYVYLYLELIFLIKRVKPKKKLKKKKIQKKVMVSYLPQKARTNITIRLINAYLNSSPTHNKVFRVGDALLYLILSGKNSFLYTKKLSMYNKLLEKKKFY